MNKPITSNKFVTDLWSMTQMLVEEAVLAEREWLLGYIQEHQPSCEQMTKAIKARGQA